MSTLEHGKRIAELIIQGQIIAKNIKPIVLPAPSIPQPQPSPSPTYKEMPKALNTFYNPHEYVTVPSGQSKTVWEYTVPPNYVLHIEQIGTNWYRDTYLEWFIDGRLREKIERFYGEINSPVDIRRKIIYATKNVKWVATNNSTKTIISEVLMDGTLYNVEDWPTVLAKI
jgi:hypothetical protein